MTGINNQEDFIRALEENPQWRAAVRARILDGYLLQLPSRFDAFIANRERFNADVAKAIEKLAE